MSRRFKLLALLCTLLMVACVFFYRTQYTTLFKSVIYPESIYISPTDVLKEGNGIIFVETTDRMKPPSLVLCAIESAARVYKDRPVVFFMKGLQDITIIQDELEARQRFPTLSSFDNVYFFPLQMDKLFNDTPLMPWYKKVNPKFERFWTHISADGCRLALIWKYGGIYMDSDFISMRPIPDVNFLAGQCSQFSSNGVFGLSHHHNFSLKSMENFVQNYNGAIWGNQGPHLFTRTLKTFCTIPDFKSTEDVKCGNISFSNPKRFYPIPFKDWKRYYDVCPNVPTFNDSYALHFWNFMNKEQKTMVPGDNTLIEHLYKQYCPTTYAALKNNEPIYG
uniref:Alpha 1,4-glycosyltransferase domain-containing protein n=1 Tax=Xenopus tropicalis TaxID=8364 RepID=A0A803K8R0_XENTR|eukprot:XP_002938166.2 PREDICTED: alpha-1,4-N-acetylglucosaminyltransferase-like [Xenopus tropicalis]